MHNANASDGIYPLAVKAKYQSKALIEPFGPLLCLPQPNEKPTVWPWGVSVPPTRRVDK